MFTLEPLPEFSAWLGKIQDLYYIQRGDKIIVLLAGGTKRTQKADIKRAKALAALLD
jgi:putative addiction module killer protein